MNQIEIEKLFNKAQQQSIILEEFSTIPEWELEILPMSIQLIEEYMNQDYYASKNARIDQIRNIDIRSIVERIYSTIVPIYKGTPLISVASQLAGMLNMEAKEEAITTCCELIAILKDVGMYECFQLSKFSQMLVVSTIELSVEVQERINKFMYLPPMIEKPNMVYHNRSSGYKTIDSDSLILGGWMNHHEEDICLDVINIQNGVKYVLDTWFIDNFEESFDPDIEDEVDLIQARKNFDEYIAQSKMLQDMLRDEVLYITNKPDKRGRLYTQGYHINPQGNEYRKAMLCLAAEELIAIPEEFMLQE